MQGDMRLFDFGLAKEVKSRDLVQLPDGYNLTGLCGSRRYMAPEVVRSVPYGFKADVFSLSILLWEMFALATPFAKFDAARHYDFVVAGKQRPKMNAQWPAALRGLMQDGWADQAMDRPDIFQVCERLEAEIVPLKGSKDYHLSTRSTYLTEHPRHSSVGPLEMED
jgi:serine/threonine-protein kinase TNNI3K